MHYISTIIKHSIKSLPFIAIAVLVGGTITYAGSLTPSATPASTSYTLGDIYTKLTVGTSATEGDHSLSTSTAPSASFYTLTELYNAIPATLSLLASTTTVPVGINPATTTLTTIDSDLVAENIAVGTTIFGIEGTLASGASAGTLVTGQTHCNAFSNDSSSQIPCTGTEQDGETQAGIAFSYTDNGNGTITDNATGLVWQKCSAGQTGSDCSGGSASQIVFDNGNGDQGIGNQPALDYCANLSLGGSSAWKLPNIRELGSLVDYGSVNLAIDSTYFPGTQSGSYWSSTAYEDSASYAWIVYFYDGGTDLGDMNSSYYVRCVQE